MTTPAMNFVAVCANANIPLSGDKKLQLKHLRESGIPLVTLTGDAAALSEVTKSFGVAVNKRPAAQDGSYAISHSTELFLTTRDGQVVKRFDLITPAEDIAREARALLARTPPAAPVVTASTGSQP